MFSGDQPEKEHLLILPSAKEEGKATSSKHSYDDTIERCIGKFGWAQFLQVILASLAWAFDAQQTFITVFTDRVPTWHCDTSYASSQCSHDGMQVAEVCALPKDAWAWDTPAHASVVSEWSLECAGPFVTGLPATSFFFGCLVGGLLLSTFADSSFGRKKMLAFSCLLMNVASILTVTSTNVWAYSFWKFLTGFARATIGTCALVLSTEIVGRRWRGQVGIMGFVCFSLGFLSLPAIAYLNSESSWRYLYLWTGIPGIIHSLLVFLFVHESPRWLYVRGLTKDFVQTIRNIAPPDTRNLITCSFFGSFIEDHGLTPDLHDDNQNHMDLYSALKVLLNKRWAVRRLLAIMCAAFGFGMVYYGIPLCAGEMPFSIYLSTALNALSELPASLITSLMIDKLRRRTSVLCMGFLCCVCSFGCAMLAGDTLKFLQIGLELVAFFSGCTGFGVVLIYTLDLFPTCVRNSAMAIVRQAMMLGAAISPLFVGLGRTNRYYSYGVFGLTTGMCCLFVIPLPETFGRDICDTIEEEERRDGGEPKV
ncbi:unnamed protein product [Cuscuta epithymum]|uniref:Major facilitator superfamily (MFS) profile domain-containing protein n=1 Tax=Cuscuta epithymum TaxID=186058 RepID=A0AAV0FHT6_9ASTE|nr:unnamed protein product [Cuscuta epithymum]